MKGKEIHYFAGDHTAKGFYPFYLSNFQGLDHVIRWKRGELISAADPLMKVANEWMNKGYEVEMIHCSADHKALDGFILPELNIGVYAGSHLVRGFGKATERFISTPLPTHLEHKIQIYKRQMKEAYHQAHEAFKIGLDIHDDLELIYISNMNFTRANDLTDDFINQLHLSKASPAPLQRTKHRFFGASTPEGVVDYIPNLTEGLDHRYFIKGRAGTGKSTFLRKVAAEAESLGHNVELYHCGFDPESIDMVVLRDLGICVFDSTDPHEYFPERKGDSIIDLYAETVTAGTDEKFAEEIEELTKSYKSYMKKGIIYLQQAKYLNNECHDLFLEDDFEDIYQEINKEIENHK
ncbi:hypothetical protein GCM10010954_32100 [Halobacillus andaensis]|uniref:ATPase n=1 Tax=Halobacillus andaensis TaxID=1176239 RepID=A0A917EXX5_HALAA|nr:hypothetical protein [Halobacillus andaensis]MBP2005316.1 hypothetical protein [Halobacillus andaensis]GGF30548.1 hypothetical protein GCM10010954_32100 [Halobacillus andaensis]